MTADQFIHGLDLFLTVVNTCAICWLIIYVFRDPDEEEEYIEDKNEGVLSDE